jgi:hypothetical protein
LFASLTACLLSRNAHLKFLFRVSFSFALVFLASQCAFSYARGFLSTARMLTLSSDSKCALELEILCNSFSEVWINAVDFESARFFGTFPKFARPDAHFVQNCAPEISAAQYKLSSLAGRQHTCFVSLSLL